MAAEGEACGQKHGGLMVGGRLRVQLPEVRQRVDVVFLLKVGEAEIELNFTQLRADAESPLVDLDGLSIAMGFGIQDTKVGERADVARIGFEHLVETRLRCRIVASVQRLHGRLEGLPGRIARPVRRGEAERWREPKRDVS